MSWIGKKKIAFIPVYRRSFDVLPCDWTEQRRYKNLKLSGLLAGILLFNLIVWLPTITVTEATLAFDCQDIDISFIAAFSYANLGETSKKIIRKSSISTMALII
jgi:hypothetical protein